MRGLEVDRLQSLREGGEGSGRAATGKLLRVACALLLGAAVLVSLLLLGPPTRAAATTTPPLLRDPVVLAIGQGDRLVVQQLQDGTRCVVLVGPNRGGVDCDWQRKGG